MTDLFEDGVVDDSESLYHTDQLTATDIAIESLILFSNKIQTHGLSVAAIESLSGIDSELYDSLPKKGYTQLPSRQGLIDTSSQILTRLKDLSKEFFVQLFELIRKVVEYVLDKITWLNREPATKAMERGNVEVLKSQAAYIKLLERRIADLEAAQIPPALKEQKQKAIDEITAGTAQSVIPSKTEADQAYSILVRAIYKHPEQLDTLFQYAAEIPMLIRVCDRLLENLENVFEMLRNVTSPESLANVAVVLQTLHVGLESVLKRICTVISTSTARNQQRYGALALPHVGYSGTDHAEYVRSFRDALSFSSETPSSVGFREDYPETLADVAHARRRIGSQLEIVDNIFQENSEVLSALLARSRELSSYIRKYGGAVISSRENEQSIRKELIQTNRNIQRSILTLLRLRSISDIIRMSTQRHISKTIRHLNIVGVEVKKV